MTSNFSSILIVFYWFFTWISLDDVDLHFSLMLVRKPIILKRKLHELRDYITSVISLYV